MILSEKSATFRDHALAPRGEEIAQQCCGLLFGHTAIDLRPVMARWRGEEPHAILDRATFRIGCPVIEPPDTSKGERSGAHGTGLERHIDIAVAEALRAERSGSLAYRQNLCMSRRVTVGDRAVMRARDNLAAAHDDTADRDFPCRRGGAGLGDRQIHERCARHARSRRKSLLSAPMLIDELPCGPQAPQVP